MGIDIYAKWKGQTEEEARAQAECSWDDQARLGCLRENCEDWVHNATEHLLWEAFEASEAAITAEELRRRLPSTLEMARRGQAETYRENDEQELNDIMARLVKFVEWCERKERETGSPVTVIRRE